MNSLDCAGFFILGLIIGGVLIHLRHQYLALVAGRLSGKEDKADAWINGEARTVIITVTMILFAILTIVGSVYAVIYANDSWRTEHGYVYVDAVPARTSGHWEYRGDRKPVPGLSAEKK